MIHGCLSHLAQRYFLYFKSFVKVKFPKMGRLRDELAPFLRSFPVKNYLIFYCPIDEGIEIVRILHGSQDIETIFQDDEN
ncbi:type II toxin-antitoxin system RelE/ParE family toxin [Nostoc sp.]|uniref:type II toxin-antitoxin system RelE/ParE family toxin n=1 Tax=Nostoc sp. TaxID=1180 RepID=UPI002FFAD2C1